jgi:excinuclease ABC subunit B
MNFKLVSEFSPTGDQPKAIEELIAGYPSHAGQVLLGVTGSGKTFTVANMVERLGKPTLVMSHNKTLAAQLYNEFKSFFPENKVCYFVSYYDYYQPESYLPQTDTYIEKETEINAKLDQLRMETIASLMTRPDVIVVASVSCIYNIGSPIDFKQSMIEVRKGQTISRRDFLSKLLDLLFERNDVDLTAGRFRVRGDVVDVIQAFGGDIYRFEFCGSESDSIKILDPITLDPRGAHETVTLFPAKPFTAPEERRKAAITHIRQELAQQLPHLGLIEAHRLEQRTLYDLEMIETLGSCKGIENYSRHFDGRKPGEPPFTLIDFFKHSPFSKDFLMVLDESHATLPQVRGMYHGDFSRKKNLVDYGFRLPSAFDNRPLKFHEFEKYLVHVAYMSATPGPYEYEHSSQVVEQIVRPTGLIDPEIDVRPIAGYIEDLKNEIHDTVARNNRVLVGALTKRSAEELAEYFIQNDIKARYLHSEIETLERSQIIKDLRIGLFDVLVGINLLREGLDIPEVGLVAILDADKEGFLRNPTSLIQMSGRAARNVDSKVIMYADVLTGSMKAAIGETERRRHIQIAYNTEHGITPRSIRRKIEESLIPSLPDMISSKDVHATLVRLEEELRATVERLDFEQAIVLRDAILKLKGGKEKKGRKKKISTEADDVRTRV